MNKFELLEKTTKMLLEILPKETIKQIKDVEKDNLIDLFFGVGLWIRNNILNDNSTLVAEFEQIEIVHKDTMSTMMIESLYEYLTDSTHQTSFIKGKTLFEKRVQSL